MSLIAEYLADLPKYAAVIHDVPRMELVVEGMTACTPDTVSVTFRAEGDDFDVFEAGLKQTDVIRSIEELSDRTNCGKLYQIRLPAEETGYWEWAGRGSVLLGCTITHEGIVLRMRFPDRDSLVGYRHALREQGCSFTLLELQSTDTQPEETHGTVTSPQQELLVAAIERGYFEIPRGITMTKLAAQFDISDQAASERLRRGLSNTLDRSTFDARTAAEPIPASTNESST